MDKLSAEQRHKNMAAIHSKGTKPELIVRRGLWSRGFRYRLNSPRLPGHPDLVLRKYRTCVFVNGCFWHGHHVDLLLDNLQLDNSKLTDSKLTDSKLTDSKLTDSKLTDSQRTDSQNTTREPLTIENSACCKIPQSNRAFWVKKIRRNQERDRETQQRLAAMGWHCITVWECELTPARREQTLRSLAFTLNRIYLADHTIQRPYTLTDEEQRYDTAAEDSADPR